MPEKLSSIAKITRPRISGIVPRTRLFNFLDSGREKSVTWISGPGGSGKTTLVASYLDACKLPCLWYEVDEGDCDVAAFFYYMALAAKRVAPRSRKPLPFLTPEYLQGITTFTLRYFENLYSRLKPPFVLVLDSYQHAPPESRLHEVIKEGLSIVPDGIHVILMSRSGPLPAFARLRANNKINLIGWDELRFTLNETREFLKNKGRQELTEDVLQTLYSRTDGWAAGLVLLLEGLENKEITFAVPEKLKLENVFNYFANEVFEKCQVDMQKFLLKTSFLPKMTPHMADMMTDGSKSHPILSELNRKNYFTQRQASESEVYQYHPLFREFLQSRAKKIYSPETITALQQNAAQMLEASGQVDDAAEQYRESQNWQGMTRLILRNAHALAAQGRSETLKRWILALPVGMSKAAPWLLYWLGICQLARYPVDARQHFTEAYALFKQLPDRTGLLLTWSGVVDTFMHEWDSLAPLHLWVRELKELLRQEEPFPSPEIEIAVSVRMFNTLIHIRPQDRALPAWQLKIAEFMERSVDPDQRMLLSAYLFLSYVWMGDLDKMHVLIQDLNARNLQQHVSPVTSIFWLGAASIYYWSRAESAESLRLVGEALELSKKYGFHMMDIRVMSQGVYASLTAGDIETARNYLKKMTAVLNPRQRMDVGIYHYATAYCSAVAGELDESLEHAVRAVDIMAKAGDPFLTALNYSCLAQVHVLRGEFRDATAALDRTRRIVRQIRSLGIEMQVYLLEAQIAYAQGDERQMVRGLRNGLAIGGKKGFMGIVYWLPPVMESLCMKALEYGIETEYVRELIRKRNFFPKTSPLACENWPWPFRLHTLGGFELKKDGKPIEIPQKPLSLLKALISFGGREVAGERLAYELWPDSEGDAAQTSLEVTLHRLRRLIGSEKAIQLRAGKVYFDPYSFWVDVWALEHIYDKIAKCLKRVVEPKGGKTKRRETEDEKNEITQLANKALGLYKGHFLPADTSCSWTLAPRESWRSKFLRIITMTGSYLERIQQYQKAVEYFQKGLEVDSLAEELYQHLMVCYRQLGRKAEAIAVYNRCRDALSSCCGVNPSSTTEALYRSLGRHPEHEERY